MVDMLSDYDVLEDEEFPPLPPPLSPGQDGRDRDRDQDLDLDRDRDRDRDLDLDRDRDRDRDQDQDLDLDRDRDRDRDLDLDPFADGDGDGDGDASALAEVPAAKRRGGGARRPQPKLDSARLTSEKGLPALRTLFDDVHYKGKGHEAEDLRLLMHRMENWAHRLFPKLQFEDFIERVEKLGGKKEVQTCLKRIRLDMPLTHDDFGGMEGEEEAAAHVFSSSETFSSFLDEPPVHSTPAPPTSSPGAALTEEQRRRIELNRQRALEKRLARQQPAESQTEPAAAPKLEDAIATPENTATATLEDAIAAPENSTPEGPSQAQDEEDPEPVSSHQQNEQLTNKDSDAPTVTDRSPAHPAVGGEDREAE